MTTFAPPLPMQAPDALGLAAGTLLSVFPARKPTVSDLVDPTQDPEKWKAGWTFMTPGGCGQPISWTECSGVLKPNDRSDSGVATYRPVEHIGQYTCSTQSGFGRPGGVDFREQAEYQLRSWLSERIERELWYGLLGTQGGFENLNLISGADEIGFGVQSWITALPLLSGKLRACIGDQRGVIHMSPFAAGMYLGAQMIRPVTRPDGTVVWEDVFGNLVIAGAGYDGGISQLNDQSYLLGLGGATGGTFRITVTSPIDGTVEQSAPIAFNASDADIQAALEALTIVDVGDVLFVAGTLFFEGRFAGQAVTATLQDATTGGTGASLTEDEAGGTGDVAIEPGRTNMFATGPLAVWADDLELLPEDDGQALDKSINLATYRAEQVASAGFDPCCHLSVLVDFSNACTPGT